MLYQINKLWKKTVVYAMTAAIGVVISMCSAMTVHAEEPKEQKTQVAAPQYEIYVNRAANCVTVYQLTVDGTQAIPVRSFACSTGRFEGSTPLGVFQTSDYYDWRLMVDGTYGQYAVRFNGSILFHSVPYYSQSPDQLEWDQFNLLGQNASLGCVRLATSDVKWIYDNCPKRTKVVVYDDATNPGPLGKPIQMTVPENHPFKDWDPTDPNPQNPWNLIKPTMKLTKDMGDGVLYLKEGSTMEDVKAAISVIGIDGRQYMPAEYEIYINGNYDLNTFGVYRVWVKSLDISGMMIEQEMIMAVVK